MSKKKKQFYVVINGHKPGIYDKWFGEDGAADQVQNFPEAVYKGFYTLEEAIGWAKEFSHETLSQLAPELLEEIDSISISQSEAESPEDVLVADKILIYTDGGAINNPGPGGYGVVLRYKDHKKELSGGFRLTTNNRMEIIACIEALRTLKQTKPVVIYSDSQYVVQSMSQGWAKRWQANGWLRDKKHRAENVDLWQQLLDLCNQYEVEFRWTKGHVGQKDNERCDYLAMEAAKRKDLPIDDGYENSDLQNPGPLFSLPT
jgi:ribonuclease HI